jgi:hypothetical protein
MPRQPRRSIAARQPIARFDYICSNAFYAFLRKLLEE